LSGLRALRRTGCQTSTCPHENMRPRRPIQVHESVFLEKSHGVHLKLGPSRKEMRIWNALGQRIAHCNCPRSTQGSCAEEVGAYSDPSGRQKHQLAISRTKPRTAGARYSFQQLFGGEVLTNLNHLLHSRSFDQLCLSLVGEDLNQPAALASWCHLTKKTSCGPSILGLVLSFLAARIPDVVIQRSAS